MSLPWVVPVYWWKIQMFHFAKPWGGLRSPTRVKVFCKFNCEFQWNSTQICPPTILLLTQMLLMLISAKLSYLLVTAKLSLSFDWAWQNAALIKWSISQKFSVDILMPRNVLLLIFEDLHSSFLMVKKWLEVEMHINRWTLFFQFEMKIKMLGF